ncbi:hypothetical protein TA3x_002641 [Tundrisphaera sp. TA3]|uniref:hypothetical protein n=1 Tax=Tundrisphaera sp. TA3 TaxID=3435775 RepID=UPI003EBDEBEF
MTTEPPRPAEDPPVPDRPNPDPGPRPADEGDPIPPTPILAPGSQDDSFLQSPHSHRLVPELTDSPSDLYAVPGPLPGSPTDVLLGGIDTSPPAKPAPPAGSSEEWDGPDAADARTPWPMVLLGSYASAVTLALGFVLVRDRERGIPAELAPRAPVAIEVPAEGPAGRTVEPLAPLAEDRTARFGVTLRVGSLAITPLDTKRRDVVLRRVGLTGDVTERKGLPGTIILTLRLQNTSQDQVFAPFEPGFVRQRGLSSPECFAETPDGERIYPYPLAFESEMGIVGQDFAELRPGESRDVVIAMSPKAATVSPESLSWRLRLRSGVDQVESIGIAPQGAKDR